MMKIKNLHAKIGENVILKGLDLELLNLTLEGSVG